MTLTKRRLAEMRERYAGPDDRSLRELLDEVEHVRAEHRRLRNFLGRLHALHWQRSGLCTECGVEYPCPTLRALADAR